MTENHQSAAHKDVTNSVAEFLLAAGTAAVSVQSIMAEVMMQLSFNALAPVLRMQSELRRQLIEAKRPGDRGAGLRD